ncbi:MAG: polysaccharide deacetylase family protein [Kordiimonadaceae bacterium]|nr:polysaccharide deacetylase family protein [Kordiimonadaceae bacterium]
MCSIFKKLVVLLLITGLFLLEFTGITAAVRADDGAVVLLYHRFGEDKYPSTNIRLEQLDAQIALLIDGGYHFMALSEATKRLKNHTAFPERTIVITVDDAYKSVADVGWPKFKAAGIPITVFVSTDPVDAGSSNYMSWDDIRRLQAEGVEIGHHSASHLHMVAAGLEASIADIKKASARFVEELGEVPSLFAYPYGEYSPELVEMIKAEGFEIAFSQYSGPVAPWLNRFTLPRFPVNERYGNMERFTLVSKTLALPVSDLIPSNPVLSETSNPPILGFTVDNNVRGLKVLACYPSHLGRAADITFASPHRIEVRFDRPFPKGRGRINCTMPAGKGRWYWFGQYYLIPGGVLD